jgi:hypothetical protein
MSGFAVWIEQIYRFFDTRVRKGQELTSIPVTGSLISTVMMDPSSSGCNPEQFFHVPFAKQAEKWHRMSERLLVSQW